MIPTYEYDPEIHKPYEFKGRGWAYPAVLTSSCKRDDLQNLIGTEFFGQKILAVESFAVESQPAGRAISLLVKEKIEFK
jgi:hypothetical protein